MKPGWQQQQQQQFQQLRRQQMGAAWQQEQEKKKRAAEAQKSAIDDSSDLFRLLEQEVTNLRNQIEYGKISKDQANARLQELMVQDEQGVLWTVGIETGDWYRFDGKDWVLAQRAKPQQQVASAQPTPKKKGSAIGGILILLVGVVITYFIGLGIGNFAFESLDLGSDLALVMAGIVWLIGGLTTLSRARKVWRGN
jgi:hypothetical protein